MTVSTPRIAWRNLGRNRTRTALAIAAIGVSQLVLVFTSGITWGYIDAMIGTATGSYLGHVQMHAEGWREERAIDLSFPATAETLAEIRGTPGVLGASARLYVPVLAAVTQDATGALVLGVEPSRETGLLANAPELPSGKRVLVGATLARRLDATVGSELAVIGQAADGSIANDLYVVGGVVPAGMAAVDEAGIVMEISEAQALFAMPGDAHEIVVHSDPGVDAEELAAALARLPAAEGMEVLSWRKLSPILAKALDMSGAATAVVLVVLFVAAAAGIANTLLMSTFERRRELGMLLALGLPPRRLVSLVLSEALLLGLAGVVLGTAGGLLLIAWGQSDPYDFAKLGGVDETAITFEGMTASLKVVPRLELRDVVAGFTGVLVTALVSAVWPAVHAARLRPVEAMRT